MKFYIADAFTDDLFSGNPAGVVILDEGADFPDPEAMQVWRQRSDAGKRRDLSVNSFQIVLIRPFSSHFSTIYFHLMHKYSRTSLSAHLYAHFICQALLHHPFSLPLPFIQHLFPLKKVLNPAVFCHFSTFSVVLRPFSQCINMQNQSFLISLILKPVFSAITSKGMPAFLKLAAISLAASSFPSRIPRA